jgi:AraC-like DNA-binding protein
MASFVEEGAFGLSVGDERWRVGAGDVMLSQPGMRFRADFEGAGFNDTCLSIVYFADPETGCDAPWVRAERRVLPASNRLRYLRWGLRRAVEDNAPMLAEYCASEIFGAPLDPGPLFSARKFGWYAERIHAARERLDAAYADTLTVGDLARGVGMSLFHFTRVFVELIGMPPHRYLLEARLGAAAKMLRAGRPVTETCYAVGFNNLSHFSRSFARRFGRAPSAFAA